MKVLIKEDSITFRNIYKTYLEELKIEPVFFDDSSQVLEFLARDTFKALILSSTNEQITDKILHNIKVQSLEIPILFCASDLNLEKKLHYSTSGVNYFLKKPFGLEDLREALEILVLELKNYEDLEVLIAEDSEPTQKVIKIYLSKYKFKLSFALDGKQAIEIISLNPKKFDLLITDLNMPNLDGKGLAKVVRYALKLEIPIIFLSGEEEFESSKEFLQLADGWISKPFSNDISQRVLPYLEKAKKYNRNKLLHDQNLAMLEFINKFYHYFEQSCKLNLKHLLYSYGDFSSNRERELEYSIQRIQEELPNFQKFLLESAISLQPSKAFKIYSLSLSVLDGLKTILEHKRIRIHLNIEEEFLHLKINQITFQFILHEFLVSFILSMDVGQSLEIDSWYEGKIFCLRFQTNTEIKNLPLWILEKVNLQLEVQKETEKQKYILKFELV